MSPGRDPDEGDRDGDLYEEEAPRSIFSAMWFRAVLVVLVLGVIGVVAVPYLLDVVNPPPKSTAKATKDAAATRPSPAPVTAPAPSAPPAPPPPTAAPAPATPPPAVAKPPAPVAKAAEPAKPPPAKPAPAKTQTPKAEPKKAAAAKAPAAAKTTTRATASGQYYVQVGAFRDAEAAKKVAARLREQNYRVSESVSGGGSTSAAAAAPATAPAPAATPGGSGDRYDVFISGTSPADINAKVAAKGLAAESVAGGVVVKPSLPLRDAVALSKDLAADGLKVQVRRATGTAAAATPAPAATRAPAVSGAPTLYRVRVGGYNDRAAAMTALKELEAKGFQNPFIARGTE